MKITPRKDEVASVVELLESDGYDSAETLAKDIIKLTFETLLERDWYALLFRFGSDDLTLAWGPFSSDNEAEAFARTSALAGPARTAVLRLASVAQQARRDQEAIAAAAPSLCKGCNHPKYTHDHQGYGGKCAASSCRCKRHKA